VRPRLLDLFCGAGGAAMGYHQAGFEVVGVDIKKQPRFPFEFHQADALEFPLDGFDVYHASPPCQAYSRAFSALVGYRKDHPDLVGSTRNLLIGVGKPFIIENVIGSPLFNYIELDGTMFGLKTYKCRWFELHGFGIPELPLSRYKKGMVKSGELVGIISHSDNPQERTRREDMEGAYGIDWGLNRHELRQAIPPAYTEYIGKYLLRALR